MRLIVGTFSAGAHEEDIRALLKRANVVIFGRSHVYYRAADAGRVPIKVIQYLDVNEPSLFTSDMHARMSSYKKGKKIPPPAEDVQWALTFTMRCMAELNVTGFKYDIDWEMGAKPKVKEVKPSLDSLLEGLPGSTPAYVPGQAASSGGQSSSAIPMAQPADPINTADANQSTLDNNNAVHDDRAVQANADDHALHPEVHDDRVDQGDIHGPEPPVREGKRKAFKSLSQSNPAMTIDLDDTNDEDTCETSPKKIVKIESHHDDTAHDASGSANMAIVPSSQGPLAFELARLLSQASTFGGAVEGSAAEHEVGEAQVDDAVPDHESQVEDAADSD